MIKLIEEMHEKFGFKEVIADFTKEQHQGHLDLRLNMIQEEYFELCEAVDNKDAEETVDALIDIIVFAIGTLDLFDVDIDKAYSGVMQANLQKNKGVKPGRPNPMGFPDLIKPEGWVAPSHKGNHGIFGETYE